MPHFQEMVYHMGGVPAATMAPWMFSVANVYHVDGSHANANDNNVNSSWSNPLSTIQAAIDLSNNTINWSSTPKRYNLILIAPGVYAENLTPAYYCHMVGGGLRGTDTRTEVHPATGSAMTGTLLGSHFSNIRFEVNTAVPVFDIGILNNSVIEDCTFTNGAAVAATGIDTENCTHLTLRNCSFESGQLTGLAYALYHRGGANKFLHNVRIYNNVMFADTAVIWIQNTCTASQAVIGPGNVIIGGAKGVDDNSGQSRVVGNYISATDAIEHANSDTHCVGNYVINDGTAAFEAAHAT